MNGKHHLPGFLHDPLPRILLFGGKGGVGKTTCATASAIALSHTHPELSFLLVSTDPAHSLADSLADSALPGNLTALEFDAAASLAAFKSKNRGKLSVIADRGTFLDNDDINRFLDLSLPGLDELMAFLEISDWVKENRYDCIVMDTAPTGHTLRLLSMPQLIRPWLSALDSLLGKHRYMKKVFSGTYEPDDIDAFLLDFSDSVTTLETLLQNKDRALFVPVMLAEAFSIKETARLLVELKKLKIHVRDVIVNKLYPENDCPVCGQERNRQNHELANLNKNLTRYHIWSQPLQPSETMGAKALGIFWDPVERFDKVTAGKKDRAILEYPHVDPIRSLPLPVQKILIFAGKGGVGKTTLACATAVHIAKGTAAKKVLLFSTDPAHSLEDCLASRVESSPAELIPGLDAMEIDGQKEFIALKKQYASDLEKLLGRETSSLDFTFDRDVMNRILDLSPPGLDEVMALLKATDFLFAEHYDVLVLDAAPTGHLIRLLEMPELVADWLRVFFELFLKYKNIFKLPRIAKRMTQMSKDIKRLRALLQDPEQASLYCVTILTQMAAAETGDLVEDCRKLGITVPVLFCNMATPENDCPFCAAIRKQEQEVKKQLVKTLPGVNQVVVYRQEEPTGIERLAELGSAMYG